MQPQVFCLGSINVDLVYQVADLAGFLRNWGTGLTRGGEEALSGEAEARLRDLLGHFGRPSGRFGGGQAANTAYALARLGFPAALVGRLGTDEDGIFIRDSLAGVNLDYVVQAGESGRAYILLDPEGERTILVAPNTNDELRESDLPWGELQQARFLHLTSVAGDGPLAVQVQIPRRLEGGPRLTFDPGELDARRGRGVLEELLDHVETLLVTEAEWALLGGGLQSHPGLGPAHHPDQTGSPGGQAAHPGAVSGYSGLVRGAAGGHPGGRRRLRGRLSRRAADRPQSAPGGAPGGVRRGL